MKLDRRRFLRWGAAATALGTCGVIAKLRTSGYSVDPKRAASLKSIAPWELVVIDAVAARICLADVPYDSPGAPPTPMECGVGEFFDGFVSSSPSDLRRDCRALVATIEHAWPLACGKLHRFTLLDAQAQDEVLASMESSKLDLIRTCFQAVKTICMMGYYRDPRTWGVLRYDGPLVMRPDLGWTPKRYVPS